MILTAAARTHWHRDYIKDYGNDHIQAFFSRRKVPVVERSFNISFVFRNLAVIFLHVFSGIHKLLTNKYAYFAFSGTMFRAANLFFFFWFLIISNH